MIDRSVPQSVTTDAGTSVDLRLREAELALRREKLTARIEHHKHESRSRVSPLLLAIVAAAAGIFGSMMSAVTQFISAERQFELENRKFQLSLLRDALTTGDPDRAAVNLQVFLDAGLLEDPSGSIEGHWNGAAPFRAQHLATAGATKRSDCQ